MTCRPEVLTYARQESESAPMGVTPDTSELPMKHSTLAESLPLLPPEDRKRDCWKEDLLGDQMLVL